jgi:cytochrome c oxidase subunit 2
MACAERNVPRVEELVMIQSAAWQITLVLVAVLLAVFAYVAVRADDKADDAPLAQGAARIRTILFWGLVVAFVPIVGYTLTRLPYSPPAAEVGPSQVIHAVGQQWRWELSSTEVEVGKSVAFHVTARDVNHGFGLYDPDLKIVAQVQAMPGYTNVLHHTFTRPGKYKVLCLEYCGLAHHGMMAEIVVTPAR